MALDWSKQISFSGLKEKAPKGRDVYPEKTYMNLALVQKSSFNVRKNLPIIIIVALIVVLFLKFGVFDFYGKVNAKQAELATQQQVLNGLTADLANYDKVLEKYEGYASMSVSKDDLQVDAVDALKLVDTCIAPSARVTSLVLKGDTLSLNLSDITLDGVGRLVSKLYEQDMVSNVSVSNAATQQTASEDVTVSLTITLLPEVDSK